VNEISARRGVVDACRRAARERLVVGTAGNASQRYGDRVAVTATGAVLDTLTEDQVVVVDLDGRLLEGDFEPTSEVELHLGLYRGESPPAAVMHTHAPVGTAVSTVLDALPVIHYQQLLLGGDVRVAPYSTFGSDRLARDVREALAGRQAALMANHGSVAVADTVGQALDHALLLEWLCRVYRDACAMGTPRPLDEEQQRDVVEAALARSYGTLRPRTISPPEETP
jgi:L-fuculose-phosphate aldolase